mmetsp:Transcript_12851/g.17759  ORF Transcript_12851/g.17759 Transcript_12851/m.17759 type:complete len:113 (-) Transcript_12851:150-488(-)
MVFNWLCHCKNCHFNRGVSPVHLIGVRNLDGKMPVVVTKGGGNLTSYEGTRKTVSRVFCKTCGCIVHQGPIGASFRAVSPVTFHVKGQLPEKYKPTMHINYESRMFDVRTSL